MHRNNIFQILEWTGQRGYFPLNENHWSNVLAWLLTRQSVRRPFLELLSPGSSNRDWNVAREVEYLIGQRKRLVDVHLEAENGQRFFIEVKVDPDYQDRQQIADQVSVLRPLDRFAIVAPLDLTSILPSNPESAGEEVLQTAVTWQGLARGFDQVLSEAGSLDPAETLMLSGISDYWNQTIDTPFEQMVKTILEEQQWTAFYPDDFKEEFLRRFPEVWASWVENRPAQGNGNPHQYLLTRLASLANRKSGFRLMQTGASRPPRPQDWGHHEINELSVRNETS